MQLYLPNPIKFLLISSLFLFFLSGSVFFARLFQRQAVFEGGKVAYQQGRCTQAMEIINGLYQSRQPFDLDIWDSNAFHIQTECLTYQESVSFIQEGNFSSALIAFLYIVQYNRESGLLPHIEEHIDMLYTYFGPAWLIEESVCSQIPALIDVNLLPNKGNLRPLFSVTCGQYYDGQNKYKQAVAFYINTLVTYPTHPLSFEAELGLLNNPAACEALPDLKKDSIIASRPDFLPLLYWFCAEAYRAKSQFGFAEDAYRAIQEYYPQHILTDEVPQALREMNAEIEFLQNTVETTVRKRNEKVLLSIGVSFIPGIGDVKDILDFITGTDLITGDPLTREERLLILGATIFAAGSAAKYADEVTAMARYSDELAEIRRAHHISDFPKYCDEMGAWVHRNRHQLNNLAKHSDELANFLTRSGDDIAYLSKHGDEMLNLVARAKAPTPEVLRLSRLKGDCSFSAGTLVTSANGLVPIETIEPGMMVLGWDEETDVTDFYPVNSVFQNWDEQVIMLGIGQDIITTTSGHPFYISGKGWFPAEKLWLGAEIQTNVPEKHAVIHWLQVRNTPMIMYNLEIDQAQTFFIGQGVILVHNKCNSTRLNQNMYALKNDQLDAHHIIPAKLEKHDVVKLGRRGGFDMDAHYNGIPLPESQEVADAFFRRYGLKLPAHKHHHPNYSGLVEKELNDLLEQVRRYGWDPHQVKKELIALTAKLRRKIINMPTPILTDLNSYPKDIGF
jgi:hypothetical protein